ncbi:decarboxylating NADP(+)-dependent phosphogluconate dehydrogenase [Candidatus Uhrbacteria bacterium]|nr:decarboxylating NADP(+)-dependent phosphogluconate dehydrogenase [Candidatus Uhrbacteria bacterium]
MNTPQADIGLIGLAVMGENLVLNMEERGYTVAVYNRTSSKTDEFLSSKAKRKKIVGGHSLEQFVSLLKKPRKIMFMVKAGSAVDEMIEQLLPYLDKEDIIIDGGNAFFKDTIKRVKYIEEKGLRYIGTGVSGGEEGARHGPSIMPGGSASAWPEVKEIFQAISAKVGTNKDIPCCDWVGPNGAGHYVKMVHNGIEYADMELISESYFLMKKLLGMQPDDIHKIFLEWNKGVLDSYLIKITADILKKRDPHTKKFLIDFILDKAGQKGTGVWTSQNALELGVPIPTLIEATVARSLSALKNERLNATKVLGAPKGIETNISRESFIPLIHNALYTSKILSYAQGFQLLRAASNEYGWDLQYGRIAYLWRGGCIIRAQFLEEIKQAYETKPDLQNLVLAPYFSEALKKYEQDLREVVSTSLRVGIPIPAHCSSLTYYDAYRTAVLSANMIQAQRDYFGAHTYERTDMPGSFHTEWTKE